MGQQCSLAFRSSAPHSCFIPNIRWAKRQPAGYEELQKRESRVLLALERVGQVLTTCTSLIFVCPGGASFPWVLVLVAAALLMILYEVAWVRYFRDGEKLDVMYQLRGPVPVPIASLPVAAFALLGIWHKSPLAAISAIIIAVGHIGIHLGHLHERKDGSREERRRKRGGRHKWLTDSWQMDFGAMQKVLIQPLPALTWLIRDTSLLYLANRTQKALLPWPKTWLCVCSWLLQPWM